MIERMCDGGRVIPLTFIKGRPVPSIEAHMDVVKKLDDVINAVNGIEKLLVGLKAKEDMTRFKEESIAPAQVKVQDESAVEMAGKIMKNAFSPVNYHDLMAAKEEIEKPRCKHHVLSEKDGSTQYECINCGEYFEIM
jgi:hypothetical protein